MVSGRLTIRHGGKEVLAEGHALDAPRHRRHRRLGGRGDRGESRPAHRHLHGVVLCPQTRRQALRDVEAQAVREQDHRAGFDAGIVPWERRVLHGRGRPARIRAGERIPVRERLEVPGPPIPARDDRSRSAPYPRLAHPRTTSPRPCRRAPPRRSPRPRGVQLGHFGDGCPAQLVRCTRRERRQGGEGVRQRCPVELRPDPAASCAMRLLERDDLPAGGSRRFAFKIQKGSPQGCLVPFVVLGPGRRLCEQIVPLIVRHRFAQEFRHPRIQRRRLRETPATPVPTTLPVLPSRSAATIPPSFSGSNPRFALQRDANAFQRPASQPARAASGSLSHASTSPHRIVGEEAVEVLRFEAPVPQRLHRGGGQLRQGAQEGLPGGRIARDVETQAAVPGSQKRPPPSSPGRSSASSRCRGTEARPGASDGPGRRPRRQAPGGPRRAGTRSASYRGGSRERGAARSIMHRSQIAGPVRSSGSYSPSTRSCGTRGRSRGTTGRQRASRSVHSTAAGGSASLGL